MQVQFWGTRGSIAKPGPSTTRFGGNTSCIELRSARGTLVIIDCGTGAHALGQKLRSGCANGVRGNILISHTHWDHIQGIPFFEPLFVPGGEWDIYGPKGLRESLREALAAQMQYDYFPVALDQCPARIRYHDLVEGSFAIGDINVSAQYLNHPAITLGYRLQADGATVVYACDHEPHSQALAGGDGDITGEDLGHAEFIAGADLLIHDAQYTAEEYPAKVGWGHSTVEYAVKLGRYAGAKRIALTHHDPLRDDDAIDCLLALVRKNSAGVDVFAASEGQVVELAGSPQRPERRPGEFEAETNIDPVALGQRSVLVAVADASMSASVRAALRAEGIGAKSFVSIDEVRACVINDRPPLAIVEHDPPRIDGMSLCCAMRSQAKDASYCLPVIMIAGQEEQQAGAAAEVTDWLVKPFTTAYVRTKVSAWLLRMACQSIRERAAADEQHGFVGTMRGPPLLRDETPSLEKSDLLWMYGREIAQFDSPAFSKKLGEIIARSAQPKYRREQRLGA
jgi:phosphoribosyl 1,2-cyclic phosphodiesterase/FixJ family two-component response regulator